MQLLIDMGNTRIKWSLDDGNGLRDGGSLVHRDVSPEDAVAFVAAIDPEVDVVGVVNVAGRSLADALSAAVLQRFGIGVRFVGTTESGGGVVNGYVTPGQLGADRWAAIVGAWQEFRTDLCVVDAGTAVTIDCVAVDGRHCGGFILPGLDLMTRALNSDTSDIEGFAAAGRDDLGAAEWLGRDTRSAVERGALLALQSAISNAVDQYAAQIGREVQLVLTGGDAARILPLQSKQAVEEPNLVLLGLRALLAEPADA